MKARSIVAIAIAVVAGAVALNPVHMVRQSQQAVVLRFGRPVRVQTAPGLYLQWPLIETAARFDTRSRTVETNQTEIIGADGGRLTVDAFAHYRIHDPERFYLALGHRRVAEERMEALLTASLKRTLGSASATDISQGRPDEFVATLDDLRRQAALARLGIEVLDVRLRHVELPAADAEAVYRRMRASGEQQAAQIRADGVQRKAEIIGDAERQVASIRGDAQGQTQRIRGEGDAQRVAVLGEAYGRDPAFARYFREMEAYQNTLAQGDTTLILSPDNAFLRDFAKGPEGR